MSDPYQAHWDVYLTTIEDHPASIVLDLELIRLAPEKEHPFLLFVSVEMQNTREDGLSLPEEATTLGDIEATLVPMVKEKLGGTFAGRTTCVGHRDFFFFVNETLLSDKYVADAMVHFPLYEYEVQTKHDPGWETYFNFLYPRPEELQSIMNRNVIKNLERQGDTLEAPRPVSHWIYFRNEEDKRAFLELIAPENFIIENENLREEEKEFPFALHISRVEKVDYNSINTQTLHLRSIALECNGDYDGWETAVR